MSGCYSIYWGATLNVWVLLYIYGLSGSLYTQSVLSPSDSLFNPIWLLNQARVSFIHINAIKHIKASRHNQLCRGSLDGGQGRGRGCEETVRRWGGGTESCTCSLNLLRLPVSVLMPGEIAEATREAERLGWVQI